jgi:predicted transcriptional regulator
MDKSLLSWYLRHHNKVKVYTYGKLARYVGVSDRLVAYWVKDERKPSAEQARRVREYVNKAREVL